MKNREYWMERILWALEQISVKNLIVIYKIINAIGKEDGE